ncbi:hypothetical protein Ciccas_007151 [Cichlidogyrus casuarinus]|uniref:Uncharacterized protein n=1 Tax=Cichlidogyrus casuarinus TaxID=1844966 RepID=A0ABD2Q3P1_9PLAT
MNQPVDTTYDSRILSRSIPQLFPPDQQLWNREPTTRQKRSKKFRSRPQAIGFIAPNCPYPQQGHFDGRQIEHGSWAKNGWMQGMEMHPHELLHQNIQRFNSVQNMGPSSMVGFKLH